MPKINFLSEDLINKIAAGEVIERPASVVKELIENSLDAKATQITVEIKDSGKKLIKVTDNGEGMSEEDARRSILRHTTSKINSAEDLFSIKTLGFRGEALASIAAVSQLSITTKQKYETKKSESIKSKSIKSESVADAALNSDSAMNSVGGFNLAVENGEVISFGITAAQPGTIIEVHNLFFNTPVRKKFLKTDAVELRHIIDVVTGYALANPKISFKLSHDKHVLLHSPAVEDARSKIASVYGTNIAKELLEIKPEENTEGKIEDVKISGFISRPYQCRNDRSQQELVVNGRCVKSQDISRAVYEGYHSALFTGKHPLYVLNLEINPEKIDVNVHPQKQEIKIEQNELVCKIVSSAVKNVLQKNNLIPNIKLSNGLSNDLFNELSGYGINNNEMNNNEMSSNSRFEQPLSDVMQKKERAEIKAKTGTGTTRTETTGTGTDAGNYFDRETYSEKNYSFEPGRQTVFMVEEESAPLPKEEKFKIGMFKEEMFAEEEFAGEDEEIKDLQAGEKQFKEKKPFFAAEKARETSFPRLPPMKILGQVHKTYFVAETLDGMFYIDQHAAHERVLYEKFMSQYVNKEVAVQKLLKGEILEFSPQQRIMTLEHKFVLEELGFHLEPFGENAFVIKTIPLLFGKVQPKEIIFDILELLKDGRHRLVETKEEIVARMACRAAVMAGDTLTIQEMEKILNELAKTDMPFTCPHGRPTIIKVTVDELEKRFKRKN